LRGKNKTFFLVRKRASARQAAEQFRHVARERRGAQWCEGGEGRYDGIWQQLVELNASGGRLPFVTAPNNLTRSLIRASKELTVYQ
jgi:hypothetical protein